ncbi:MAG: ChaN family lipoprotein [Candidatus Aminicenantes bacterium]|nr:ChaN family lipoprotein [Candidatus Aminicenantes bacterium]
MKHAKTKKGYFILIALIVSGLFLLADDESKQNTLPLGPSEYKFEIGQVEKDKIIETATNKVVTMADIVKNSKNSDVFIIGEAHNSYECHTFQRDFIDTLYKENPKIIVGFEFFLREDNETLESWLQGTISEAELLQKAGWYKKTSFNYGYTRLVMDVIKKHKIKVIGLNIPRTILRQVSRKGYPSLSAEEKKLFPTIGIYNREHEYFIKSVFGSFAVQMPMWFTNIYNAQKCWDVIMAASMRKVLSEKKYLGYQGVIIAGSNHVAYKLGIPFRYKKTDNRAGITTIIPVYLPEEEKDSEDEDQHPMMKMMGKSLLPAAIFSRGIGDYVFSISRPEFEFFPVMGMKTRLKDGKIVVTKVDKDSIAEKNGIRKDDIILSIDGVEVTSLEQMRMTLVVKNWDDSVNIELSKRIEIKKEKKEEKKNE